MNYNGYLILTDIDGTLTPRAGEAAKENIDAIEYFKENGGLFTFATGRMPEYLSRFPFRANAPIVTTNGTLMCDGDGNTLWKKTMPEEDTTEVLRYVLANHTGIKTIQRCYERAEELIIEFLPPEEILDSLADGCPTYKMVFICDTEEDALRLMGDLIERYGERFSYDRSWPVGLEMHHKNSGKGECVKILRQMLPQIHTIITAGDYENDLTMLREADIGCAVANAIPSVKEAADRIIVHCEEHALAHIIYDLIPALDENGTV